jgi:hypothetical protein
MEIAFLCECGEWIHLAAGDVKVGARVRLLGAGRCESCRYSAY